MIPTILAAALWLTGGMLIAALIEELDGPSTSRPRMVAVVVFWPLVAAASSVQAVYDYVRTYKGL